MGRVAWRGTADRALCKGWSSVLQLRILLRSSRQTWRTPGSGSFVSSGCGFGFLLRLGLGTHGVKAGSGTGRVGINPRPEFSMDKPWESVPEAWAGSESLWLGPAVLCSPAVRGARALEGTGRLLTPCGQYSTCKRAVLTYPGSKGTSVEGSFWEEASFSLRLGNQDQSEAGLRQPGSEGEVARATAVAAEPGWKREGGRGYFLSRGPGTDCPVLRGCATAAFPASLLGEHPVGKTPGPCCPRGWEGGDPLRSIFHTQGLAVQPRLPSRAATSHRKDCGFEKVGARPAPLAEWSCISCRSWPEHKQSGPQGAAVMGDSAAITRWQTASPDLPHGRQRHDARGLWREGGSATHLPWLVRRLELGENSGEVSTGADPKQAAPAARLPSPWTALCVPSHSPPPSSSSPFPLSVFHPAHCSPRPSFFTSVPSPMFPVTT